MARHLRIEYAGALYHVTARGNDRRPIFETDADREHFLELLAEGMERYEVVLYAYVLMTNHYHLVLRTEHPNLHCFMHYLNTAYVVWTNRRNRRTGHLFEGPYHAILMEDGGYLLTVTAYTHLNPVRTKLWRERPFAERYREVDAYPWSSYTAYTRLRGVRNVPVVSCNRVWGELHARSRKEGRKRYREYVSGWLKKEEEESYKPESKRDSDCVSPFGDVKHGCVLGGEAFLEFVHGLFEGNTELSQDLVGYKIWRKAVDVDHLITLVAQLRGTDPDVLKERRRGHEERDLAMYLCREAGEKELATIGGAFGVKYAAVSIANRRVRQRMRKDAKYRDQVQDIRKALIDKLKT